MPKRLPSDEARQLWQDYQAGDMYALASIMQGYYADLFNWGMRLHSDREFVKDCIQDVFVNLWRIQTTVKSVDNVRAYLLVVLKTQILRELAKPHQLTKTTLLDDYSFSVEFSADIHLIEDENEIYQISKLQNIINHLSTRQKELIYLRFYQGLSFDEIADVMQLGRQSVYNLFQKSMNNFRKKWPILILGIILCI